MPEVILPDDLTEQLESSETETIDGTDGAAVASYFSSDELTRAYIFVGLNLDGVRLYENISSADPTIKMQFALEPVVACQSEVVKFTPGSDSSIAIQV